MGNPWIKRAHVIKGLVLLARAAVAFGRNMEGSHGKLQLGFFKVVTELGRIKG